MNQNSVIKELSYLRILRIVLSKWHWVIFSICIGLLSAFIYLSFVKPIYSCYASLKFDEKRSELSELTNIKNLYDRTNKIESEAQVIKSRNVLTRALRSLNYPISFFIDSGFSLKDVYPQKLLSIKIKQNSKASSGTFIGFKTIAKDKFRLSYTDRHGREVIRTYRYGELIRLDNSLFSIDDIEIKSIMKKAIYFRFNDEPEMIKKIMQSLKTDEEQNVNVMKLRIVDHNPQFATDILNAIIDQYIRFDKQQRSVSATQTELFTKQLLDTISNTGNHAASNLQQFQEENAAFATKNDKDLSGKLSAIQTEQRLLDIRIMEIIFVKEKVETPQADVFNFSLQTVTDTQLIYLLQKQNELTLKKQESAHLFPQGSIFLVQIEEQIAELRKAISTNISVQYQILQKKRVLLSEELSSIEHELRRMPGLEQKFTVLQSESETQQKVIKYLREKQLEAQVSKSAVTSGAIVIDEAQLPLEPLYPVPANVYTASLLLALFGSTATILLVKTFNAYIHTREEIEEITEVGILGLVARYNSADKHDIPVISHSNSAFSESIRSLRSSFSFMAMGTTNKIVHLTSEISGEGKSFIAVNLAASLTLLGKKVMLIGADLRRSSLHHVFKLSNRTGLSKYLVSEIPLNEIIEKTSISNLDFISSGISPPNPSELLIAKKMSSMLLRLRDDYDYIIIDSAPIGMVSDCKPLIALADINIFILRTAVSRHHYALTPQSLQQELDVSNFSIVLNDYENNDFYRPYYKNKYL